MALSGSPRPLPRGDKTRPAPADRSADGVGVVDLAEKKLTRVLAAGTDPACFDFSPDGRTIYVSNGEAGELSVVDLASGALRAKVLVGADAEGVTVRPDGKFVYVTSNAYAEVTMIDTATLAAVAQIPTGPRSRAIVFTKDGRTAFVTSELDSVTVLDVAANRPSGTILFDPGDRSAPDPRPMGAVFSPDGNELYVSCGHGGSVVVVDVATRKQLQLYQRVGDQPWGIGISHDGTRLYTANGPSDDISVVNAATGGVLSRVAVGRLPFGIAVTD